MRLLEEIQNDAVNSESDLGTLLRKCKVLATRLDNKPLENWLIWESNGYPEGTKVPTYRIWPLEIKGNFFGPLGRQLKNAPISLSYIPDNIVDHYRNYQYKTGISVISEMVGNEANGHIKLHADNLASVFQNRVYQHYNCLEAWGTFPSSHFLSLLNSVRNRILDFSLAIWKEYPAAGDLSEGQKPERQIVNQIVNNHIYGGSQQVIGINQGDSTEINISVGDFVSLEAVLKKAGVSKDDIGELQKAIENDGIPKSKGNFGERVSAWLGKMVQKSVEGVWNAGSVEAGKFLVKNISKYFGWG